MDYRPTILLYIPLFIYKKANFKFCLTFILTFTVIWTLKYSGKIYSWKHINAEIAPTFSQQISINPHVRDRSSFLKKIFVWLFCLYLYRTAKGETGSKWEREMGWDWEMTAGRTRIWVPVGTRTRMWYERCSLLRHKDLHYSRSWSSLLSVWKRK